MTHGTSLYALFFPCRFLSFSISKSPRNNPANPTSSALVGVNSCSSSESCLLTVRDEEAVEIEEGEGGGRGETKFKELRREDLLLSSGIEVAFEGVIVEERERRSDLEEVGGGGC